MRALSLSLPGGAVAAIEQSVGRGDAHHLALGCVHDLVQRRDRLGRVSLGQRDQFARLLGACSVVELAGGRCGRDRAKRWARR